MNLSVDIMPNSNGGLSMKQLRVHLLSLKEGDGKETDARTFYYNTLANLNFKISSANGRVESSKIPNSSINVNCPPQ